MGRLSAAHVTEFGVIKQLCYRGLDSAELRERVGDRLTRHLGLSSYCFGATDPSTALPLHSVTVGLDPSVMPAFYGLVLATPSLDFGRGSITRGASAVLRTSSTTSTMTRT